MISRKYLKFILIIVFLVTTLPNITVKAEETELTKAFKEVMYAYYMRGESIQYNDVKLIRKNISPEESTSQNNTYTVCAGYATLVYNELANITIPWSKDLIAYGANSIKNNRITKKEVIGYGEGKNGKLIWYSSNADPKTNPTTDEILNKLQVGDIIKYTTDNHSGHTMLVYDLIYKNGKVDDAYIMHSWQSNEISSKFTESGQRLMYDMLPSKYVNADHVFVTDPSNPKVKGNSFTEGSIRLTTLKNYYNDHKETIYNFDNPSKIDYLNDNMKYVILRFLTTDSSGNIKLNYNDTEYDKKNYVDYKITLSSKIKERVKYSKLLIKKVVDVGNNNVVANDSTLTYTIVIRNNSGSKYNNDLVVTEKLTSNMTYKASSAKSSNGRTISVNTGTKGKLKWNLGKLASGEKITITYKVSINGNKGTIIKSTGTVGNISSSTVKNTIGTILSTKTQSAIKTSYNTNKSKYSGVELIDKIYQDVLGISLNLTKFNIENMFCNSQNTYCKKENRSNGNAFADNYVIGTINYKNIMLNMYGRKIKEKNGKYWPGLDSTTPRMADTIYPNNFVTGDILIYTNTNDNLYKYENGKKTSTKVQYENGTYAYIYIDGEGFVGVNNKNSGAQVSRNSFNSNYYQSKSLCLYSSKNKCLDSDYKDKLEFLNYQTLFGKDAYIILRPSLSISVNGDVDGDSVVGTIDYIKIRKHLIKIAILTGDELKRADVNNDGKVNASDYNAIRKIILGIK